MYKWYSPVVVSLPLLCKCIDCLREPTVWNWILPTLYQCDLWICPLNVVPILDPGSWKLSKHMNLHISSPNVWPWDPTQPRYDVVQTSCNKNWQSHSLSLNQIPAVLENLISIFLFNQHSTNHWRLKILKSIEHNAYAESGSSKWKYCCSKT